jgi:hypothetical protein
MLWHIKIFIISTIFLTSCGGLNPPEWLQGQWKNKNDSINNKILWTIDKSEIHSGDYRIESTIMIDRSEIIEPNRYIIRADHSAEKEPYFEIFKRTITGEIIYYDSSVIVPRRELTLTRVKQSVAGNH